MLGYQNHNNSGGYRVPFRSITLNTLDGNSSIDEIAFLDFGYESEPQTVRQIY